MDSYFNFDKLKQYKNQIASSAAKYLPTDLIKQIPYKHKLNEQHSDSALEHDDQFEITIPANKRINSNQTPQKQGYSPNGNEDEYSEEEQKEQIREKREDKPPQPTPDPDQAINSIIKALFAKKQVDNQSSAKIRDQAINLMNTLNQGKINRKQLQMLSFKGIPDEIKGLRPIIWRILLFHLPLDPSKWQQQMDESLNTYNVWKDELIVKPTIKQQDEQKHIMDHPLSVNHNSQWNQFFKDQELWDEIEKDVKRTRTDMSFFYQAVDPTFNGQIDRLLRQAECKKSELNIEEKANYIETHSDVLARILFIYAKLNPGIKYVQGMNEVLAVLYYCFWSFGDESIISNQYLESDLFFCFNNLMIEIRDGFLRELDQESTGISGKVRQFARILEIVDPLVFRNLEEQGVNHQFYSLRWLMLLMCQEFNMSNVIRLWDTLLSDENRFNFLNFVCAAAVKIKRVECLHGDFAECLENLQKAAEGIEDVRTLIVEATAVYLRYNKALRKEYLMDPQEIEQYSQNEYL